MPKYLKFHQNLMASSNSKPFKISLSCYFYNLGIYCNSDLIKGDKDIFHI